MNRDTKAPGAGTPEGHDGDTARSMPPIVGSTSGDPMHAAELRDLGMGQVLCATSAADRAAVTAALLAGFDPAEPRRAEEALARVHFVWPPTAPPRVLGAIVRLLARAGRIVEAGWTKGRSGRSRAGRVSLWKRASA